MQVATLFRESSKLLDASTDGSMMDNGKYCARRESQVYDSLETNNARTAAAHVLNRRYSNNGKMLGGPGGLEQSVHSAMDDHNRMGHHRPPQLPPKMDHYGDPYSFVDEPPNSIGLSTNSSSSVNSHLPPQSKKRGRRKKPEVTQERMEDFAGNVSRNPNVRNGEPVSDTKERKRHDRFNGLTEEEVSQRTLPDHLAPNLDVVIIGINPGLFAAYKGHHYAGPGNHFWKCLYLSGLVPEPLTADDDGGLVRHGIGFTNMVQRPTKGSADLTRREIKQGCQVLLEKLQKYRPKVAVFNGKLIFEVFSGKKDFPFGRQRDFVEGTNTYIWVMPSSSARCAQLPRAADKVPFYCALKKFLDYLKGLISEIDDSEVTFSSDSKPTPKAVANKEAAKKAAAEERERFEGNDGPGFPDSDVPYKKKRGRPRKGTEKNPPNSKKEKLMKKESNMPEINGRKNCYDPIPPMDTFKRVDNMVSNNSSNGVDVQRKRRGRPKKAKQDGSTSNSPPSYSIGSSTTPDALETGNGINNGTCKPPTASSVSSGYSTATSSDDRSSRREENGSLSNAGSGGPSPSHHSYTTQSDLSSEISAAISCGSAPPSPMNGHAENIFDNLSGVLSHSRDEIQKHGSQISKMSMSSLLPGSQSQLGPTHGGASANGGGGGGSYMNSSIETSDPSFLPYHHPSYDSRLNNFNNRNELYHSASSFRDSAAEANMQSSPSFSNQTSYEPAKPFDVASKSLSGLESLVDQIPSIADSDVGAAPASSSGNCIPGMLPEGISHPQPLPGSSTAAGLGHYPESSQPGFLSYGPPSSYSSASHYSSSPYYASELTSPFPVNSLGPAAAYCSPPTSAGMLLGYPGYHGQYGSHHGSSGYSHSSAAAAAAAAAASIHLHSASPYGGPPGYPPSYSGPSGYPHGHSVPSSTSSSNPQRYPQRLHLRQEGMDLGHMGFGGY